MSEPYLNGSESLRWRALRAAMRASHITATEEEMIAMADLIYEHNLIQLFEREQK